MKKTMLLILMALLIIAAIYFTHNNESEKKAKNKIDKLTPAELAVFRADHDFIRLRNPKTNQIPEKIRERERTFKKEIIKKAKIAGKNRNSPLIGANSISPLKYVGPENISGRLLAVHEDIENPNTLFIGSASGGLWKSTDQGASWEKKTPVDHVQSVTCIAQQNANPDIMYYGTGELLSTTDRRISLKPRTLGLGNGIFKSTDRGETWQLLNSTIVNNWKLVDHFQGIWNIVLDESNQSQPVIYAACYGGILRSKNGGNTWETVFGNYDNKPFGTYIATDGEGKLYAVLGGFTASGETADQYGVFVSEDGENWEDITPVDYLDKTRVMRFEVAPSDKNRFYLLTETPIPDDDPTFGFTASEHNLFRGSYADNEYKWENISLNLPGGGKGDIRSGSADSLHGAFNSIGGYALALAIDPDDQEMIFAGGISLYRNDRGFTDSTYNAWMGGYPYNFDETDLHPDIHDICFSRHDPDVLYVCCDGGFYVAEDYRMNVVYWNWISDGLRTQQIYWVSQDMTETYPDQFIVCGAQDNAINYSVSLYPGEKWDVAVGGDGLTVKVADNREFILGSVYNGNVFSFTLDENFEVNYFSTLRPDKYSDADFNFFTNFVLDPNDNKTFYLAGKNKIMANNDITKIVYDHNKNNEGWFEIEIPNIGDDNISTLNISKEPADILFVGTAQGKIYKIEQSGDNYQVSDITSPLFPDGGFVSRIDIDRYDADKLVAVFSNYEVLSIFGSSNGGETWISHSGNLEENFDGSGDGPSVRWVSSWSKNEGSKRIYLAGTSLGLFATEELTGDNTIWQEIGQDSIGGIIVDMLEIRPDGTLAIATQGGGIYSGKIDGIGSVDKFQISSSKIYPNPSSGNINIIIDSKEFGNVDLKIYDVTGNSVFRDTYNKGTEEKIISIDLQFLQAGTYVVEYTINDKAYWGRFVIVN